jgi:hypothetical protein
LIRDGAIKGKSRGAGNCTRVSPIHTLVSADAIIAGHSGMQAASLSKRAFFGSLQLLPPLFQQSKTITANLHEYFGPDFP